MYSRARYTMQHRSTSSSSGTMHSWRHASRLQESRHYCGRAHVYPFTIYSTARHHGTLTKTGGVCHSAGLDLSNRALHRSDTDGILQHSAGIVVLSVCTAAAMRLYGYHSAAAVPFLSPSFLVRLIDPVSWIEACATSAWCSPLSAISPWHCANQEPAKSILSC